MEENVFARFQTLIDGPMTVLGLEAKKRLRPQGWSVFSGPEPKQHRFMAVSQPWGTDNASAYVSTCFEIRASRTPTSPKTILRFEMRDTSGEVVVTTADGARSDRDIRVTQNYPLSQLENQAELKSLFDDFVQRVISYGE